MPVVIAKAKYPDNIIEKIKANYTKVVDVPALDMAKQCGNIKTVNVVMIGVIAQCTEIEKEIWLKAVEKTVKPQFVDVNIKAFNLGYDYARSCFI